jgi:hypothetical protein
MTMQSSGALAGEPLDIPCRTDVRPPRERATGMRAFGTFLRYAVTGGSALKDAG